MAAGTSSEVGSASDYALGYSSYELRRLTTQARLIDPITRRFFVAAGIGPGMRVLEVGSGAGDVALLLADLVGKSGSVVGTDISAHTVAAARQRIAALGVPNVSFEVGDPSELSFATAFDAVAGRYVLQFMPDPAGALSRLAAKLVPGGLVVFHELDWEGARSVPPATTYDRCCRLCAETIGRLGAETSMGAKLAGVFRSAGLRSPAMRLEAVVGAGPDAADKLDLVADLVRTLLPDMERLGIIEAGEIEIESLSADMLDEILAGGCAIIGRSEVGAWTRI